MKEEAAGDAIGVGEDVDRLHPEVGEGGMEFHEIETDPSWSEQIAVGTVTDMVRGDPLVQEIEATVVDDLIDK